VSRARIPTEHEEQKALFQWAGLAAGAHPELRLMYAIPNGGHRLKAVAGKLAAEGVKAGVPDTCLPVARGEFHGLYIEMKRRDGGALSGPQRQWIADLNDHGYQAECCYGWDEAREVIEDYLAGEPWPERHAVEEGGGEG